MSGAEHLIIPCICGTISIIEELIEVRAKMKNQDASAMTDLLNLMKNYDKYSKKEKRLIRETLQKFLEQNISLNNSQASLDKEDEKK